VSEKYEGLLAGKPPGDQSAAGVSVALSTAAEQDFCLLPHGIVAGTGGILTV
jgi:hypothetical protein